LFKTTGTKYYSTTDSRVGYAGLKPGGSYIVKVTYVGYQTTEIIEINAPLGNNNVNVVVKKEESNALKEVVIWTNSQTSNKKENRCIATIF
jgi:hypothetical protein